MPSRPASILVVDDEPFVRGVTCRYLEEAGFTCVPAGSAANALDALAAGCTPELLVLDVRLPDVPGPELALCIHERYPHIPVLFVSGWIDGLTSAGKLAHMRWHFLQKPFTGEAITEAARQLIAH